MNAKSDAFDHEHASFCLEESNWPSKDGLLPWCVRTALLTILQYPPAASVHRTVNCRQVSSLDYAAKSSWCPYTSGNVRQDCPKKNDWKSYGAVRPTRVQCNVVTRTRVDMVYEATVVVYSCTRWV